MTTDICLSGLRQGELEEDLAMPLRWSGYRLRVTIYIHVAPPEPKFPRKQRASSIKGPDSRLSWDAESDARHADFAWWKPNVEMPRSSAIRPGGTSPSGV